MSEWKTTRLGNVCTIKYGKDHKHLANGTIPVYGSGGIMRYGDNALYRKKSVLIPRKGSLDNLYFVEIPFWSVDTLFYTEIDETQIQPEFLYYQLKLVDLAGMNVGTAVPSLTTAVLNEIEIIVPPLAEQRSITSILSSLDDKIANNNAINHHLEQMAQAIFKSWFVDFEPFADGSFVESELGEIPKGWRVMTLGDVCDVKGGKRLPKGENLISVPNSHPYIRVRDMNNTIYVQRNDAIEYVSNEVRRSISRYIVSTNDVIVSIVGTIGMVCKVHSSLNNANLTENCVKLTNWHGVTPDFLYLFLSSVAGQDTIKRSTVGAVQAKLPIKNIQTITFVCPPSSIMSDFDEIVSQAMQIIANNYAENQRLSETRDTLLPRLMSGELSVIDIDNA